MAQSFLDSVTAACEAKSRGGHGDDGLDWEPTKKFLEHGGRMLYVTGKLLRGFKIEVTSYGFRIYNDVPYAPDQLHKRLPWPTDQIPASWLKRMLDAARPFLIQIVTDAINTAVRSAYDGPVLVRRVR